MTESQVVSAVMPTCSSCGGVGLVPHPFAQSVSIDCPACTRRRSLSAQMAHPVRCDRGSVPPGPYCLLVVTSGGTAEELAGEHDQLDGAIERAGRLSRRIPKRPRPRYYNGPAVEVQVVRAFNRELVQAVPIDRAA